MHTDTFHGNHTEYKEIYVNALRNGVVFTLHGWWEMTVFGEKNP